MLLLLLFVCLLWEWKGGCYLWHVFLCGFLFPRRLHYIHCTRVSADPFSCPLPSPVCQGQYFPTGQSTRTLMGWVVMETWHQKTIPHGHKPWWITWPPVLTQAISRQVTQLPQRLYFTPGEPGFQLHFGPVIMICLPCCPIISVCASCS